MAANNFVAHLLAARAELAVELDTAGRESERLLREWAGGAAAPAAPRRATPFPTGATERAVLPPPPQLERPPLSSQPPQPPGGEGPPPPRHAGPPAGPTVRRLSPAALLSPAISPPREWRDARAQEAAASMDTATPSGRSPPSPPQSAPSDVAPSGQVTPQELPRLLRRRTSLAAADVRSGAYSPRRDAPPLSNRSMCGGGVDGADSAASFVSATSARDRVVDRIVAEGIDSPPENTAQPQWQREIAQNSTVGERARPREDESSLPHSHSSCDPEAASGDDDEAEATWRNHPHQHGCCDGGVVGVVASGRGHPSVTASTTRSPSASSIAAASRGTGEALSFLQLERASPSAPAPRTRPPVPHGHPASEACAPAPRWPSPSPLRPNGQDGASAADARATVGDGRCGAGVSRALASELRAELLVRFGATPQDELRGHTKSTACAPHPVAAGAAAGKENAAPTTTGPVGVREESLQLRMRAVDELRRASLHRDEHCATGRGGNGDRSGAAAAAADFGVVEEAAERNRRAALQERARRTAEQLAVPAHRHSRTASTSGVSRLHSASRSRSRPSSSPRRGRDLSGCEVCEHRRHVDAAAPAVASTFAVREFLHQHPTPVARAASRAAALRSSPTRGISNNSNGNDVAASRARAGDSGSATRMRVVRVSVATDVSSSGNGTGARAPDPATLKRRAAAAAAALRRERHAALHPGEEARLRVLRDRDARLARLAQERRTASRSAPLAAPRKQAAPSVMSIADEAPSAILHLSPGSGRSTGGDATDSRDDGGDEEVDDIVLLHDSGEDEVVVWRAEDEGSPSVRIRL